MTQRREQVVRLAEALEIEFERSMGTLELMEMCITEVEDRRQHPPGEEDEPEFGGASEGQSPLPAGEATHEAEGPKHRAGGNGARQQRRSRAQWEAEQARRQEAAEARESAAEAPEGEIAPVLAATRKGPRRRLRAAA